MGEVVTPSGRDDPEHTTGPGYGSGQGADQAVTADRHHGLLALGGLLRQLRGVAEAGGHADPDGGGARRAPRFRRSLHTSRGQRPEGLRQAPPAAAAGRGWIDDEAERTAHVNLRTWAVALATTAIFPRRLSSRQAGHHDRARPGVTIAQDRA